MPKPRPCEPPCPQCGTQAGDAAPLVPYWRLQQHLQAKQDAITALLDGEGGGGGAANPPSPHGRVSPPAPPQGSPTPERVEVAAALGVSVHDTTVLGLADALVETIALAFEAFGVRACILNCMGGARASIVVRAQIYRSICMYISIMPNVSIYVPAPIDIQCVHMYVYVYVCASLYISWRLLGVHLVYNWYMSRAAWRLLGIYLYLRGLA